MHTLLVILIGLASLLMCFIVLIQESKGGGLASGFSSSNQIMGVRKTTDFLEKATWGLAGALVLFSVVITSFIPSSSNTQQSEIKEEVNKTMAVDPNTIAPNFGTAQQAE